jgi:hypothetical protein
LFYIEERFLAALGMTKGSLRGQSFFLAGFFSLESFEPESFEADSLEAVSFDVSLASLFSEGAPSPPDFFQA